LNSAKRGIDLIYSVKITHLDQDGSLSYEAGGKTVLLKGDAILVATGRSLNTKDLHGKRTGLTLTPDGAVVVDDHLQSVVPGIFAMGDVIGGLQFTCISLDDFRIVKSSLEDPASPKALSARHNAPYSVFISPAFSRVGLSESEAKPKASLIPYLNFRLRPSLKL
jgi:pyruvate/2-oxoglutarate dehydrogenase complex dihydrolipoamide dehydrogenase (E3) component